MVQIFHPISLYEVMQELGFEYHTEQTGDVEFHAYFYKTTASSDPGDIPMRPAALTNMPLIDDELGKLSVSFWDLTWNDSNAFCPMNSVSSCPRLMPVGAGRTALGYEESVKAYIHGLPSAALDDVFELLAWYHRIGFFSSEIGCCPPLFQAYKTVRNLEKQGKGRAEIGAVLKVKFGEKNPDIKVQ